MMWMVAGHMLEGALSKPAPVFAETWPEDMSGHIEAPKGHVASRRIWRERRRLPEAYQHYVSTTAG